MKKIIKKELQIINKLGLHARAAAKFVKTASGFDAELTVSRNDRQVNGKSIMGIMTLAASKGSTILLEAQGDDAQEQVAAIEALVNNFFEEGE